MVKVLVMNLREGIMLASAAKTTSITVSVILALAALAAAPTANSREIVRSGPAIVAFR